MLKNKVNFELLFSWLQCVRNLTISKEKKKVLLKPYTYAVNLDLNIQGLNWETNSTFFIEETLIFVQE